MTRPFFRRSYVRRGLTCTRSDLSDFLGMDSSLGKTVVVSGTDRRTLGTKVKSDIEDVMKGPESYFSLEYVTMTRTGTGTDLTSEGARFPRAWIDARYGR